jgi:hypothetical protein
VPFATNIEISNSFQQSRLHIHSSVTASNDHSPFHFVGGSISLLGLSTWLSPCISILTFSYGTSKTESPFCRKVSPKTRNPLLSDCTAPAPAPAFGIRFSHTYLYHGTSRQSQNYTNGFFLQSTFRDPTGHFLSRDSDAILPSQLECQGHSHSQSIFYLKAP